MANPDVGITIGLLGLAQYQQGLRQIDSKTNTTFSKVGKSVDGVDKSFAGLAKNVPGVGSALGLIANPLVAITAGLAGAGAAILSFVDDAAQFEEVQIQFKTLIGDAGRAEDALNELAAFAATTPFQFEDLAGAGRNLLAFGTTAEELTPTLRRLGDISAGIGAPIGEIAELYGKIRVQNKLMGDDLAQILGRGIPIVGELAKQFGVAESEVRQLVSEGRVGFPELEKAFISLTSAGGRFAGLTQNLSESYSGQLSTFRDNIDAVSRTMGQALLPAATSVLRVINDLIGGTSRYSDELEDERIELNVLISRIGRYNEGNEDRAQLIQELNQKYPGFLGNLNTETATNEELANRLREVNQQYINKIIIQKEEEAIAEQVNELSEAQSKILKKEIEITRDLVEIRDKYNISIEDGLSLQEEFNQTVDALQELDRTAQFGQRQTNTIGFLRGQWFTYTNAVQDAQEAEQQLSGLQQQRDEIAKRLGVTTEDLVESTENVAGATQKAAENLLDFAILPTTPIKILKEQLDKVNEAIENIDPTSVEFKALNDQADAIERRISQIEGKVTIDTGDATQKVQTLAEKLDELGISLNALNNFNELTGLSQAIPLASIEDSAERAKSAIVSIAIEPNTPLSSLEDQLSNINKALQLIDPESAGFEYLARQAGILESRIARLNAELSRLAEGGPRNPIVFPIELDDSNVLNQVQQVVVDNPVNIPVNVDVNDQAFTSLSEAARLLNIDIDFLNQNFSSTEELLQTLDSSAFKFGQSLSGSVEQGLKLATTLDAALDQIGRQTVNILADSFASLGADIARVTQGTQTMSGAFNDFALETLATVLESGTRIAGLYLMELALAGGPAALPIFLAGAGLAGLSGLIPELILGDDPIQTPEIATPDILTSSPALSGPSLATGQADQQTAVGLSDYANNVAPAVYVTIQLDGEDISDQIAVVQAVQRQLTG